MTHEQPAPSTTGFLSAHFFRRAAALAVAIAVYAGISSIIEPRPSPASERPPTATLRPHDSSVSTRLAQRQHPLGRPLLGMLEGNEYIILVYGQPGTQSHPLYTVCSLTGEVLAADLEPADVNARFPGVDLTGLHLDPGSQPAQAPLMLADPQGQDH